MVSNPAKWFDIDRRGPDVDEAAALITAAITRAAG
jgi:hypothetical protein